ncbi:flagellar biosynthetic protein FlhB [Thermoanaerobacter mathranii subsp. mathranii str. A3]|uniref:Flagellar biosynthetic protein FlhB n=2 Tax=Thermoanaerobacter TaxID=1754 RepID=D3T2M8_THEIA|nr:MULTISPECIES: flagellar biosynthesis protein FlhB [Thermoanaerobacter]ADD02480.1 flagellar biosynthetic protein FlhB [Thermoanaerobacter italicus Ab9]ADH60982.1 flagellar biosynthetic protein FlhB [Thermoanaerobacter mathranii subsp. mathranii str. A3]
MIVLSKINLQLFAEEKTEPATPKRRQDARKKGQVFQSREITSALVIVAGFLALNILAIPSLEKMMALTKYLLYTYSGANDDVFNVVGIRNLFTYVLQQAISIIIPIILLIFVVSLVSTYLQVGFVFTTEPLAFKLERLNPVEGFKRIFSKRALVELAKSIAKVVVLFYIMYSFLASQYKGIPMLLDMSVQDILKYALNILLGITIRIGIVLIVLGALDYFFQWREYEVSLKMSKEDIKEEFKETEGNPQIKAEIRRKQRQVSMRRMMQDLKKADVVITNPTHLAVALMYDSNVNDAPVVIAKGQDMIALRIKEEAKKLNIPIVENKPLAQALYRSTEIGDMIPPELYQAVAEVLAYVYSLKEE